MNGKIFISHATCDAPLAEALQDLLDHGLGLPHNEIFRSTRAGDIPAGYDFVKVILKALQSSVRVVSLITPEYLESKFCLAELGAAQMRNLESPGLLLALTVAPTRTADAASNVLTGTQVSDASNLREIKQHCEAQVLHKRAEADWKTWADKYSVALQNASKTYRIREGLENLILVDLEVIKVGQQDTKTVFKNKLYLTFKNAGEEDVEVEDCYWNSGSEGVPLARLELKSLSWHPKRGGKWNMNDELSAREVKPGDAIRTWIALDDTVDCVYALHRHAAKQLGFIILKQKGYNETRQVPI